MMDLTSRSIWTYLGALDVSGSVTLPTDSGAFDNLRRYIMTATRPDELSGRRFEVARGVTERNGKPPRMAAVITRLQ